MNDYHEISVTKLSPHVGAEIGGVEIAGGVSDAQFAEIRQAYADHGVIFFRDQEITPDDHIAFAKRWSDINVNRFFTPVASHPNIAEVRKEPDQRMNIGTHWHTDHSYDQIPAMGSILVAREVPEVGGDTLFASMAAPCEALSEGLRSTLANMRAFHTSERAFGPYADKLSGRIGNEELALQNATHPVIIKHPLSGRPCLYVNTDFTVNFEGWSEADSRPLLKYLYGLVTELEFTCRFDWRPGSIAIWDNRAVQHKALNDYHGHRRLMHRITLEGVPLEAAYG